jgi:hypothetical protein
VAAELQAMIIPRVKKFAIAKECFTDHPVSFSALS